MANNKQAQLNLYKKWLYNKKKTIKFYHNKQQLKKIIKMEKKNQEVCNS